MSPKVMNAWSIAQSAEAAALAGASAWCLRAEKWKLAFVPLVCAGHDRPCRGYWLLGDGDVGRTT